MGNREHKVRENERMKERGRQTLVKKQDNFFKKETFPGGPVVKKLPAKAGYTGSISGLGRFHMP